MPDSTRTDGSRRAQVMHDKAKAIAEAVLPDLISDVLYGLGLDEEDVESRVVVANVLLRVFQVGFDAGADLVVEQHAELAPECRVRGLARRRT